MTTPSKPPSPPTRAQTHGGAPGRLTARHTPPSPPTYHPPSPLPDTVAHKPPKHPRPPSPAAHAKAPKHARQPLKPFRPLSLKRTTAGQPQPEPPPPKRLPRAHPCHPPRAPPEGDRCSAVRDRHSPLSCAQSPRLHHAPIPQGCSPAAQQCPDAYPHSIVRCRPGHQRPQCARSAVREC